MTTDQATQIIAEELSFGAVRTAALRAAKSEARCYLSQEEYEQWVQAGKKAKHAPKAQHYAHAIGNIHRQAREWNWTAVSSYIESAYSLLGAEHPVMGGGQHSTGYAYHRGAHPIQAAMAEIEK
jgi:hypothetical protein